MAHLCKTCIGLSPPWDGHDVNPPCEGHKNFMLLRQYFKGGAFVIPADLPVAERVKIGQAIGDRANQRKIENLIDMWASAR